MANPHHGRFADFTKHLVVGAALEAAKPRVYVESHAGAFDYDYPSGDEFVSLHGALLGHLRLREAAFARALRAGRYPGSAALSVEVPSIERRVLCELDRKSAQTLAQAPNAEVLRGDGVRLLRTREFEAGSLVFVDPFSLHDLAPCGSTPLELVCDLVQDGVPALVWFGYTSRSRQEHTWRRLEDIIIGAGKQAFGVDISLARPLAEDGSLGSALLAFGLNEATHVRVTEVARSWVDACDRLELKLRSLGQV